MRLKWGEDTGDKGEASATEAEAPAVTCHPSDHLTALRASECSKEGQQLPISSLASTCKTKPNRNVAAEIPQKGIKGGNTEHSIYINNNCGCVPSQVEASDLRSFFHIPGTDAHF